MGETVVNPRRYLLTVAILKAYVKGLISADTARRLGRMLGLGGFGS